MNKQREAMKPCPFCGSTHIEVSAAIVDCMDCGARIEALGVGVTNEDAARMWNIRYPAQQPAQAETCSECGKPLTENQARYCAECVSDVIGTQCPGDVRSEPVEPVGFYKEEDRYHVNNGGVVYMCGQRTGRFTEPLYTAPQPPKAVPDEWFETINRSVGNMEYAAYNLCDGIDMSRVEGDNWFTTESTCPEASLLIAIRDIKALITPSPTTPDDQT